MKTKPAEVGRDAYYKLKRTKYAELRTWQYTFSNGVKVVLRADDSQKDIVLNAICPGGASLLNDADYQSAVHAGEIIRHCGLGDLNAAELKVKLDAKNVVINPTITDRASIITGTFTREEIETALQAITLYFTHPKKDDTYFAAYIKELKNKLSEDSKNPYAVFQDTVDATLWGNRSVLTAKDINGITMDKVYNAFSKCFGNANGFTFIFTGHLQGDNMNEPAKLAGMFEQYLGSLPSTQTANAVNATAALIPQGKIVKTIYNGNPPLSAVNLTYSGLYEHTDSVVLQLKVLNAVLKSKLNQLAAFNGANKAVVNLILNKYPKPQYAINVSYKCSNVQTSQTIADVKATIQDLQKAVSADDLKAYVDQRKKELKVETFDYKWWSGYLSVQFFNSDDPYVIAHYPYNFHKATSETLQQAATQYLNGENYIQLTLMSAKTKTK
ncbi:MAG: M16 family metallopeptidase [Mucilaginibacter sp.]|uniref:M16 family metallopeptidase n=1 Tax=Mucilaginibacter sp. TaxID=1882438 RepID=UPI0034E3CC7B